MKILVVGGTQFIGRHVVQKLLEGSHSVTLLNRGKTAPHLFPNLPRITVDRGSDEVFKAEGLRQDWDAVIDLSAYYPRDVKSILEVLKGRAGRYVLCSTLSVYEASSMDGPTSIIQEENPMRACSEKEALDTSMATYGQRKAECERVAMGQHKTGVPVVVLRPSIVFGAFDHTDRFAYWIWKASKELPFILPDEGLTITRRTYAPDLAKAFVTSVSSDLALGNAYNIAETDLLSFRDTLYYLGKHLGTKPMDYAVSLPSDYLLKKNVRPWADLPLWIPKTNLLVDTFKSRRDLLFVSTSAPQALADAADAFLSEGREPKTGLSVQAEKEILAQFECVN